MIILYLFKLKIYGKNHNKMAKKERFKYVLKRKEIK